MHSLPDWVPHLAHLHTVNLMNSYETGHSKSNSRTRWNCLIQCTNRNDSHKPSYLCPHGFSCVSATSSQHREQQFSRILTCFNRARRLCLSGKHSMSERSGPVRRGAQEILWKCSVCAKNERGATQQTWPAREHRQAWQVVTDSIHTGWADHKLLTGQVTVGSHIPGLLIPQVNLYLN